MSFPAFHSFIEESDDRNGPYAAETDPLAVKTRKGRPVLATGKPKYPGPRCSVLHCTNKKDDCDPAISFHRFPKSPAMQLIWKKKTRPPLTSNLQNRFVCAIHFDSRVLKAKSFKDSKRRLKRTAIPTLHLPPPEGEEDEQLVLSSDLEPSSELEPSEPEIDVDDNELSLPQSEMDLTRDIEMVELSSDEDVGVVETDPRLTSADALAATSALHVPTRPTGAQPKIIPAQQPRKSFGMERSPAKSVMDVSMDSSYHSDEEGDDDDIALVPTEELDYMDLHDPLESDYRRSKWKTMDEKSRRGTLRSYFSRIASYLPPRFPRNSKMAILESAMEYLDEVTKSNASFAVEEEILLQKHYRLRKVFNKLDRKTRGSMVRS